MQRSSLTAAFALTLATLFAPVARPLLAQDTGTVTGTVFDSTAMASLAGARVAVIGTSVLVEADDRGRFTLTGVPVGRHPVTFFHPRLQELGISASSAGVEVTAGGSHTVALAIPSETTLLRAWCAAEVAGPGYTPAAGFVRDSITGVALPSASVTFQILDQDGRIYRFLNGRTDESGYYRVCGLPSGENVQAIATFGRNVSLPMRVEAVEGGAVFQNLELVLTSIGEVRGTVMDYASRRPLSGALVRVAGTDAEQLTDADGEFFITDLPPGLHLLETEHVGYAAKVDSITIFSDEAVLVEIPLAENAIEIAGLTVTARARVGDPLTDLGRRQDFIGRVDVERLLPRVRHMGDLLSAATFPGLSIREVMIDSGAGTYPGLCVEHNRARRGSMGCRMITVYVDNLKLPDPAQFILDLDPTTVESIQLYSPTDAALRFGQDGVNGVVVITTRRGR